MAARPYPYSTGSALSTVGLMAAVCVGAWWTADAVVAGSVGGTLARFAVSVAVGLYYLMLTRAARTVG